MQIQSIEIDVGFLFPMLPSGKEAKRREIVSAIESVHLSPEDHIRLIVIDAHGRSENDRTELKWIGSIGSENVDSDFVETFRSIVPFVSSDVRIVLNSCNALCGNDVNAAARARTIMNFLGAKDGAVYGAMTSESYLTRTPIESAKIGMAIGFASLYIGAHVLGASIDLDPEFFKSLSRNQTLGVYAGTWGTLYALLIAAQYYGNQAFVRLMSKRKRLNYGRLFEFKGGAVFATSPLSKFYDLPKIYGAIDAGISSGTCEHMFKSK